MSLKFTGEIDIWMMLKPMRLDELIDAVRSQRRETVPVKGYRRGDQQEQSVREKTRRMWCPGNQLKRLLEGDDDQPCEMMLKLSKTSHPQCSCEILLTQTEVILLSVDE